MPVSYTHLDVYKRQMKDLVEKGIANNIKSARKMVERAKPEVWDSLETVIKGHPCLLYTSRCV